MRMKLNKIFLSIVGIFVFISLVSATFVFTEVFSDDFDDNSINSSLWNVYTKDLGSSITEQNNLLNLSSGSGYAHTGSGISTNNFSIEENYTIEFDYKQSDWTLTKAGSDGFWITPSTISRDAHYGSPNNGVWLQIGKSCAGGQDDSVALRYDEATSWHCSWSKTYDTNDTLDLDSKTDISDGDFHRFKIIFDGRQTSSGDNIFVYINDSLVLQANILDGCDSEFPCNDDLGFLGDEVKFVFHQSHYPYSTDYEFFSVDNFNLSKTSILTPTITLVSPADDHVSDSYENSFNCSSSGADEINLWGNWSGSWHEVKSNVSGNFNVDLSKDYVNQNNGFSLNSSNDYAYGITNNGTHFFVGDISDSYIYCYDLYGTSQDCGFDTSFVGADDILGVTTNGTDFWVTDLGDSYVYHFDQFGNNLTGFDLISNITLPIGITYDGVDFWVVDRSDRYLYHLDSNGNELAGGINLSILTQPQGVEFYEDKFYVGDYGGSDVFIFDLNGNYLGNFDVKNSYVSGVSVVDSEVYVLDNLGDEVINFISAAQGSYVWGCEACVSGECGFSSNRTFILDFNTIPTQTDPTLEISNNNLICMNQSTLDLNGDSVTNIYNWKKNSESLAVLNMPFENSLKDYSGLGNDGELFGATYTNKGKVGGAYEFDGVDDYINLGDSPIVNNISEELTLMGWVYSKEESPYQYILSNDRDCCGTWDYGGYGLKIYNKQVVFNIWGSESTSQNVDRPILYSQSNISLNDWYHIVATFNGTQMKIYINGQLDNSFAIGSRKYIKTPASYDLVVGALGVNPSVYNFNGTLDEVRIYNKSLSSNQINKIYSESKDGYSNSSTIVSNEFSDGENWTCEVTPNDGKVEGLLKGASLILDFVNETLGRDAILEGANNSLNVSYNIYTDLEIDVSYLDLNQSRGVFDLVVSVNDQFFAFSYVTNEESYTNIDDSIGNVFNVLEMADMSYEDINESVNSFINARLN